ncbi:hypothetical protein Ancab_037766 [Ancistrocladus abbreviatus]
MPSRQPPPPGPPGGPPLSRHHFHALPHRSHLVAPVAAATISFSLLVIIAILYRKLARKRTAPAPHSDHQNNHLSTPTKKQQQQTLRRFPYSVLRRATSSFSASNRLGRGGFGSVYRGILPSSGQPIAVKLMDTSGSLQGEREFQNEVALASRINDVTTASRWPSPFIVSILGYSSDKRDQRKLIVYELMVNGSLQDKLLDQKCVELMDWEKRFGIVLQVAKALEYLHFMCGRTAVVHGDVKPSNVLLDGKFNAKLGDFGLSRILEENDVDVLVEKAVDERDESGGGCEEALKVNGGGGDTGSIIEKESVATRFEEGAAVMDRSPESCLSGGDVELALDTTVVVEGSLSEGLEKASLSESCMDGISVESGNDRRVGRKKSSSRRDWWWKQENVGSSESGRVKDYVMEWIGNEIKKDRPKGEWIRDGNGTFSSRDGNGCSTSTVKIEPKKHKKRLDWWASFDEDKLRKKEKTRKPREWWREEFCEELTNKKKKKKGAKSSSGGEMWWRRDEDFVPDMKKRKRRSSLGSIDWWLDGLSGELRSCRRNSHDWASWDMLKSGGISSTPSMRGTVCYIAPEYGGGGQLSEKCDVYSFGVLALVILSGRRPLQVMASPMSEFERANLISWTRQLAYNGKLLDLIDPSIQSLDREQALLCITIALLCLQRSPSKRPNMKEIVEMLTGEAEPPHLPFEFSPSPPSNLPFKSRKKAR